MDMIISLIATETKSYVIGKTGVIPWKILGRKLWKRIDNRVFWIF